MVARPCVSTRRGTSSGRSKNRALSARVRSVSSTTRVSESSGEPGSLNPTWPFEPMPSTCTPIRGPPDLLLVAPGLGLEVVGAPVGSVDVVGPQVGTPHQLARG